MRSRNLKPGFFKNEDLAALGFPAMILFSGLWCLADREGRLEYRPKRIKAEVFPYSAEVDIDALLESLVLAGFLTRYSTVQGEYAFIPRFLCHQSPHVKEKNSTIPEPDKHQSCMETKALIPDSLLLIPDSPLPDSGAGEKTDTDALFRETSERMYMRHPKKKNMVLIPMALVRAVNGTSNVRGDLAEIEMCHDEWRKTDTWTRNNGQYAPKLDEWIADKGFTQWPNGKHSPTEVRQPLKTKKWDPEWHKKPKDGEDEPK